MDESIRIIWDYAWTAREAFYGYRYFLLRDGQFLRQTKDCRIGFTDYDQAEDFVVRLHDAERGAA